VSVSWIKITTTIFDDEKIKIIDTMPDHDAILVIWIKLLTLAGKSNAGGILQISDTLPYTNEMLAAVFNRPLQTVNMALAAFESLGMIEKHDKIQIINWEKHQNAAALETIRKHDAERKRIQRDKQKLLSGNVPDKSRKVHILEEDKELDKDKDIREEPTLEEVEAYILSKQLVIIPQDFIEWYENTGWKDRDGKPIKNWKNKLLNWNKRELEKRPGAKPYSKPVEQTGKKCSCGGEIVYGVCQSCGKLFDGMGKEL